MSELKNKEIVWPPVLRPKTTRHCEGCSDVATQRFGKGLSMSAVQISTTIPCWLKQLKDTQRIEYRGAPKTGGYYILKP